MGFNYAKERRKFDAEWKKLRKEYEQAGMADDVIDQLYQFDLETFRSWRNYSVRTQRMPDMYIETENEEEYSSLLKKFNTLSTSFDESDFSGRYAWTDTVNDSQLAERIKRLNTQDLEILTLYAIFGYSQSKIAQIMACNQSVISRKLARIKKVLS